MTLTGMDPQAIRSLGRRLKAESSALSGREQAIDAVVRQIGQRWRGPDSAEFAAAWNTLRTSVRGAAEQLRHFGDTALQNADAQDQASAADGPAGQAFIGSGAQATTFLPPIPVAPVAAGVLGNLISLIDPLHNPGDHTARRMDRRAGQAEKDHDFDPGNIYQHGIGDCYVVSPLIAIAAKDPQFLKDRIRVDEEKQEYVVKLYRRGNVKGKVVGRGTVLRDGGYDEVEVRVPFDRARFEGGASGPGNSESLVAAYETAVAQASSWDSNVEADDIDGGFAHHSLSMLTGKPADLDLTPSVDDVERQLAEGRIVTASSNPDNVLADLTGGDQPRDDVVKTHVYAVDSVYTDEHGQKMIKLVNPWGVGDDPSDPARRHIDLTPDQFERYFMSTSGVALK